MTRYALRRIGALGLVLLGVNALSWLLTAWLRARGGPGGRSFGPEPGLGEYLSGYAAYLSAVARGDLGHLPDTSSTPLTEVLAETLPLSLLLLALALVVASVGGIALGYLGVDAERGRVSPALLFASVAGFSMPAFYVGIMGLQAGFMISSRFHTQAFILPSGGYGLDRHLILPVVALSLRPLTEIARLTAELVRQELAEDYVRTALAKGLSWRRVVLRHAFRNTGATVATAIGGVSRYLISSLVVVEVFFLWPGAGRMLARAIAPRTDGRQAHDVLFDPAIVAGLVTALALLTLGVNFFTSLAARRLDPRLAEAP